jgi:hypothetical protein
MKSALKWETEFMEDLGMIKISPHFQYIAASGFFLQGICSSPKERATIL